MGNKVKDKLESLDLKREYVQMLKPKDKVKPFEANVSYSGGTKEDVIDMILNIMDSEDIDLEELRDRDF